VAPYWASPAAGANSITQQQAAQTPDGFQILDLAILDMAILDIAILDIASSGGCGETGDGVVDASNMRRWSRKREWAPDRNGNV
jgi:hypothetical protein